MDWNYYSNSIEGGTLTKEETRSVMIGNVEIHGKSIKDVVEMRGHDGVVNEILKVGKGEVRLSEKRVKEFHKSIMYEERPEYIKQVGVWKIDPNEIINYRGEKFEFAQPTEVPELMHKLLDETNAAIDAIHANKKSALHPVEIAIKFHLDFVAIHPFYDGNGRMARILTNLILISFGYPPFIVRNNEKDRYNQLLGDIQGYGGDSNLFFEFLIEKEARSMNLVLDAIEGKSIEEDDDLTKEIELLKTKLGDKNNLTKSPRTVYQVFEHINSNLWIILDKTLSSFNDFFSDNKSTYLFNHIDAKSTKKININPFIFEEKKAQIFGHDIYSMDIKNIQWKHDKYGLTNSKNAKGFNIELCIDFNPTNYNTSINLNKDKIINIQNGYGDFLSQEQINYINKTVGKILLEEIKSNMSG